MLRWSITRAINMLAQSFVLWCKLQTVTVGGRMLEAKPDGPLGRPSKAAYANSEQLAFICIAQYLTGLLPVPSLDYRITKSYRITAQLMLEGIYELQYQIWICGKKQFMNVINYNTAGSIWRTRNTFSL